LKQKLPLSSNQLINLLKKCTKIKNSQVKGRKFEQAIGICFNSLGNCEARQAKNKDVFVYVKPSSKLYHYIKVVIIECKNMDQEVSSDHMGSLANKLEKYYFFGALGIMIHRSKLQEGAIESKGSKPIIVITLSELIDYLNENKGIDDLILEKFPSM